MDNRLSELTYWLENKLSITVNSLTPASADASFRRYFRLISDAHDYGNSNSLIVMDAPPSKEPLQQFISVANMLEKNGVHTPKIHATNQAQGFLLLEDLGNRTYLEELTKNTSQLYTDALDALLLIQNINKDALTLEQSYIKEDKSLNQVTPKYNDDLVNLELNLFTDWYCSKHKQTILTTDQNLIWQTLKKDLIKIFKQQPKTWVHRDFHSRNLMITNNNSPGIIDFQDLVWGPLSYDLVSIFKDCYIEWPRNQQIDWLEIYLHKRSNIKPELEIQLADLIKWYDLTGLQRHLKVLGIFSRLNYRDNKPQYLNDLPLVEKYINETLSLYPEFESFQMLFNQIVQTKPVANDQKFRV